MQFLSNLGKTIFPRYCFCCGRSGSYLCQSCCKNYHYDDRCYVCNNKKSGIIKHDDCLGYAKGSIILYQYRDGISKLLQSGKYLGTYRVYESIGKEMCGRMIDSGMISLMGNNVVITYVPIHQNKLLWKRGYNQGRLIAQSVAEHTGIDCKGLFSKNKQTKQQSRLNRSDRLGNLKDVFTILNDISHYSDILLIDDVISTGSTLDTISQLIRTKNKTANIWYLLIARSD